MKTKETIATIWKAYLENAAKYAKQIDGILHDPYLTAEGQGVKIAEIRSVLRSTSTSFIDQMTAIVEAGRETLDKQYVSRGTYTAPGMTPAQYQAALTNTLELLKQTAGVISEAEYQSLVEPFRGDPLAVKALNALLAPRAESDQWNAQWFSLPIPENPANSYMQLSATLGNLKDVAGRDNYTDDFGGSLEFLHAAIEIQINDLPE